MGYHLLMRLKIPLPHKSGEPIPGESDNFSHPFPHWLLVIFGTLSMGLVFSLVGLLMFFSGWVLFQSGVSWLALIVGFPMLLVGLSVIFINLYQILASILDRRYSKTHCLFCKKELP